jgi:hypothetical protein
MVSLRDLLSFGSLPVAPPLESRGTMPRKPSRFAAARPLPVASSPLHRGIPSLRHWFTAVAHHWFTAVAHYWFIAVAHHWFIAAAPHWFTAVAHHFVTGALR